MRLDNLLKDITGRLKAAGIENPRLDCEVLAAHALDIEKYRLISEGFRNLSQDEIKKIEKLVKRRLNFEPVAYITGVKEFYSLDFAVNKDVLIPRPETELLVDMGIYWAPPDGSVLDLCTGSGAAAIAIKYSRVDLKMSASDISEKALKGARKNSRLILGSGSIRFFQGNLFEPFKGKKFDLIVSNPPYVSPEDKGTLQRELFFEPEIALFASDSGRDVIRRIIEEADEYLTERGVLLMEIGSSQGAYVEESAARMGYAVTILNDYAGQPRVATFKRGF